MKTKKNNYKNTNIKIHSYFKSGNSINNLTYSQLLIFLLLFIPSVVVGQVLFPTDSIKFPGEFLSIETDGWKPETLKFFEIEDDTILSSYDIGRLIIKEEKEVYINVLGSILNKRDGKFSGNGFLSVFEVILSKDNFSEIVLKRENNKDWFYKPFLVKLKPGDYQITLNRKSNPSNEYYDVTTFNSQIDNYKFECEVLIAKVNNHYQTFDHNLASTFDINKKLYSSNPNIDKSKRSIDWQPPNNGFKKGSFSNGIWTPYNIDTLLINTNKNYTDIDLKVFNDSVKFDLFLARKEDKQIQYLPIVLRATYFKAKFKDLPPGLYQIRPFSDVKNRPKHAGSYDEIKAEKRILFVHYYTGETIFSLIIGIIISILMLLIAVDVNLKRSFLQPIVNSVNNKISDQIKKNIEKILRIISLIFIALLFLDEMLLFLKEYDIHLNNFFLNAIVDLLNIVYVQIIILIFINILLFIFSYKLLKEYLFESGKRIWLSVSLLITIASIFLSIVIPLVMWYHHSLKDNELIFNVFTSTVSISAIALLLFLNVVRKESKRLTNTQTGLIFSYLQTYLLFIALTEHLITRVILLLSIIIFFRRKYDKKYTEFNPLNSEFFKKTNHSFNELMFFYSSFIITVGYIFTWKLLASPLPPADSLLTKPGTVSLIFSIPIAFYLIGIFFNYIDKAISWILSISMGYFVFYIFPVFFNSIYSFEFPDNGYISLNFSNESIYILPIIGVLVLSVIILSVLDAYITKKSIKFQLDTYQKILTVNFFLLLTGIFLIFYTIIRPYEFELFKKISNEYAFFFFLQDGLKIWFLEFEILLIILFYFLYIFLNKGINKTIIKNYQETPENIIADKSITNAFNISLNHKGKKLRIRKRITTTGILMILVFLIFGGFLINKKYKSSRLVWMNNDNEFIQENVKGAMFNKKKIGAYSSKTNKEDYLLTLYKDQLNLYSKSSSNKILGVHIKEWINNDFYNKILFGNSVKFEVENGLLVLFLKNNDFCDVIILDIDKSNNVFQMQDVFPELIANRYLLKKHKDSISLIDLDQEFKENAISEDSNCFKDYDSDNVYFSNELIGLVCPDSLFVFNTISKKGLNYPIKLEHSSSLVKIDSSCFISTTPYYEKNKFLIKYNISDKEIKGDTVFRISEDFYSVGSGIKMGYFMFKSKDRDSTFVYDFIKDKVYRYSTILDKNYYDSKNICITNSFTALLTKDKDQLIIDDYRHINMINLKNGGRDYELLFTSNKLIVYSSSNLYVIDPKTSYIEIHLDDFNDSVFDKKTNKLVCFGKNIYEFDLLKYKKTKVYHEHLSLTKKNDINHVNDYFSIGVTENSIFAQDIYYGNFFCFDRNKK